MSTKRGRLLEYDGYYILSDAEGHLRDVLHPVVACGLPWVLASVLVLAAGVRIVGDRRAGMEPDPEP